MNIIKTIKNIRATCDDYIDPDLVATVIYHDNYIGTNNILDLKKYDINSNDNYEKRVLKVLNHENIFITLGMLAFIPILNECDIYSTENYSIKLTQEEFDKYGDLKEEYFGILIKKDCNDLIIGSCDLCGCKIDSSFREIKKSEDNFYKKLKEIALKKIN